MAEASTDSRRPSERAVVDWLLACDEPAVRLLTRRDLLGEKRRRPSDDPLAGAWVRALLQETPGHPYSKWTGAHWRLVSMAELGVPAGEPRAIAAAEQVLGWLTGEGHRRAVKAINGRVRRCGSQEGNALAACCRLGLARDPRVRLLADSLVEWQWPDGGWNCDRRPEAYRSSFNETLPPMWGLHEYATATGSTAARQAASRAAELFLSHRLFRSLKNGEVIKEAWLTLRYPPYWHYEILQALLILSRMGLAGDPRAAEALDIVEQRRLADGRWRPGSYWWRAGGQNDVVDWGRSAPNVMITLNALRVLVAAGRLSI